MATLLSGRPPGRADAAQAFRGDSLANSRPDRCPASQVSIHAGLQLHRGIADMMRYATLNQGGDDFADFGGFVAIASFLGVTRIQPDHGDRYSDEQLFALALYLY